MRKFICSLVLAIICSCMLAGVNFTTVSAADNSEIYHAGYYNGTASGNGLWYFSSNRVANMAESNAVEPVIVPNTLGGDEEYVIALEHLSNGQDSWYDQSILTWQTNASPNTNLLSGEFEAIVELHPTQTVYPTTVKFRMANANSGATTADFIGLDVISLGGIDALAENEGKIMSGGEPTGLYYKADATYTFKVVTDTTNDTYSVYLVSGPVATAADGAFEELGDETLLNTVSGINNNNFGFVRTVDFMITGLPTNEDMGVITYFKNIEFNILPYRAYLKSDVNIGDTDIPLAVSHWVAAKSSKSTSLSGTILVKKNGIPLEYNTDYTVAASYCARSTLNSWSRNPVITLTQPIVGGDTFEIDMNDVEDNFSRNLEDSYVTFTISAQSDDKLGLALETLDNYILNENEDVDNITTDLNLVSNIDGVEIVWSSSDTDIIAVDGHVTPPASFNDARVTLSAALSYEGKTYNKVFDCIVKTTYDGTHLENALDLLTDSLILGENSSLDQITQNMNLLTAMEGNIEVSWMSSNKNAIGIDGTVVRPGGYNDYSVLLTATLTDGTGIYTKKFTCVVKTTYDPNRPPMITDVAVAGIERAGNTLEISYTFDDINKLGDNSRIQWEYSADGIAFSDITGANSKSCLIDSAYVGGYVRVAITPVNSAGNSNEVVYSDVIGPILAAGSISGQGGGSGSSSRPSSGGSGGGSGGGIASFTPPYSSETNDTSSNPGVSSEEYSFLDVPENHWAADSVNRLVSAGVISRDDSRSFRPDDSITRDEFVKMVVIALNIEGGSGSFADMDKSYWAYKYAAAALHSGIVTGYEDGTFRGGQPITRQEIAVILKRAADYSGWNGSMGEPKEFVDSQDISDFAIDSVSEMSAAGVISGMPDGRFLPGANATRAEAAKMISEVYANV